jgi:hypothetical protein
VKIESYCVKCRTSREIEKPIFVTMKNGRCAAKGPCVHCGATIYKILSKECSQRLEDKKVE